MTTQAPSSEPAQKAVARPTPAYTRHAWFAVLGILFFALVYLAFIGGFAWTAIHTIRRLMAPHSDATLFDFLAAASAIFLAAFMIKALFFIRRDHRSDDIEITAAQQPELFEFLHALAKEAGAPKPAHVYLSSRVNAAVFYDLSLLNLFWPSRKNLEIGLGLVNVLTLSEFKAVCAHEFGHFAQRTMAVGRWVYIAQQIAADIVAKRGSWDDLLTSLSRWDFRIAWIGWVLRLIIWSIRSLMDSVFGLALIAQRALSREMEMQADLVAVSLTGSDALIHALHRLQAADQAWDRTVAFVNSELANKHAVVDLFAIQTRELEQMAALTGDERYGKVPPVPAEQPQAHRVFKATLAQPPRMWATHPLNHEREENAKRRYFGAELDDRSAWTLFRDAQKLREDVSANLQRNATDAVPAAMDETLARCDAQYAREYFNRRYRGAYLGRSPVLHAREVKDLYGTPRPDALAALAETYPASLSAQLEHWRGLEGELAQLESVRDGHMKAADGILRHRGRTLRPRELPALIEELRRETQAARDALHAHDRLCRTAHRQAAASLGADWAAYHAGLVALLHYATHAHADVLDARGVLANTMAIETATRKVSERGAARIIEASLELRGALGVVYSMADRVDPGAAILQAIGVESWPAMLGSFELAVPTRDNINEWIKVIDSWVDFVAGQLDTLKHATLEELLVAEHRIAEDFRRGAASTPAPAAPKTPEGYATRTPAELRPRRTKLSAWQRFQTADGLLPALARGAVACAIVAPVLGFGFVPASMLGEGSKLVIYNGLARRVEVSVDAQKISLEAGGHETLRVNADHALRITTKDANGNLIETFTHALDAREAATVYNVASASPLMDWIATYGDAQATEPRRLGAPEWVGSGAQVLFEEPPKRISMSKYATGGTREVLSGFGGEHPWRVVSLVDKRDEAERVIAAHARWDDARSRHIQLWLHMLLQTSHPQAGEILAGRLKAHPHDVPALRAQQDYAGAARKDEVCRRHQALAAAEPENGDLQYAATRCLPNEARRAAVAAGHARWPDNAWWRYAFAGSLAEQGKWQDAAAAYVRAMDNPALVEVAAIDLARIRRMAARDEQRAQLRELAARSDTLDMLASAELTTAPDSNAYAILATGDLDRALKLAEGTPEEAAILHLAAASVGAPASLVGRASTANASALRDQTIWPSLALAARNGRSLKPYKDYLAEAESRHGAERTAQMLKFLDLALAGRTADADAMLLGLDPYLRGQACVMGIVIMGSRVPPVWRDSAHYLLFANERPYLGG